MAALLGGGMKLELKFRKHDTRASGNFVRATLLPAEKAGPIGIRENRGAHQCVHTI